jgi:NAD(P)-dependent dehydrogenase (short-subunit alcohol dehydrogenase family)
LTETIQTEGTAWLGLAGRVCVVTGAGRGIGAETARQLAAVGASVAVLDRDGESAATVATEIAHSGRRAIAIAADVTRADAVAAAAEKVRQDLGVCDVLVNNAALVGYAGPLMDADVDQWNQTLAVNLTGALVCAQAFGRQMIAAGRAGCIVNVASICGHFALPRGGAYSVGKSGLMMLTRLLALELAEHGIRCNSVSPGFVHTPATDAAYRDADVAEGRRRAIPSGRIATPLDLANTIVFVASDRAGYINGQDILVDGAVGANLMNLMPRLKQPMPATGR